MNKLKFDIPFYLFSNCINVKGAERGIIYDLQRSDFSYIPNSLNDIFEDFEGKTINEVLNFYGIENKDVIIEYFEFLLEKEHIFFSNLSKENFPKIKLDWHSPFKISNLIIDVSINNFAILDKLFSEIENIGCEAIALRFLNHYDFINFFEKTIFKLTNSRVRTVEVFLPYFEDFDNNYFDEISMNNQRIFGWNIFNSKYQKFELLKESKIAIFFHKEAINDSLGNIPDRSNFFVNLELFVEAKKYNVFYNKKVYIDENGDIHNSPNTKTNFGNISHISLEKILEQKRFQKYWEITKDIIEVCCDCEYRYMCSSSNNPAKKNKKMWIDNVECRYDPYTSTWK